MHKHKPVEHTAAVRCLMHTALWTVGDLTPFPLRGMAPRERRAMATTFVARMTVSVIGASNRCTQLLYVTQRPSRISAIKCRDRRNYFLQEDLSRQLPACSSTATARRGGRPSTRGWPESTELSPMTMPTASKRLSDARALGGPG